MRLQMKCPWEKSGQDGGTEGSWVKEPSWSWQLESMY